MNVQRIQALVQRHLLLTFRTADRLLSLTYWPFISVFVWGNSFLWVKNQYANTDIVTLILTAIILWQITNRISIEVANNLHEELVSRNIVNLFSTPLHLSEWVAAMIILGLIDMIALGIIGSTLLWFLFHINLFSLGWALPLYFFPLFISGLTFGFLISSIFITWGSGARDLMHAVVWLIGAFSALYSPVNVLPPSIQTIAWTLPTTYIFEALRFFITHHSIPLYEIGISYLLNSVYFIVTLLIFKHAFEKSRIKGLARLL